MSPITHSPKYYRYEDGPYQYVLSHRYADIAGEWHALSQDDICLQGPYLEALEASLPSDLSLYYLSIRRGGDLIGISYFQQKEFVPGQSLQQAYEGGALSRFWLGLTRLLGGLVRTRLLVWGNLMLTGRHGFALGKGVSQADYVEICLRAVEYIHAQGALSYDALLVKDMLDGSGMRDRSSFIEVEMEPEMELADLDRWENKLDYEAELSSKYRVRLKRARKKFKGIVSRRLTHDEILVHAARLHSLYLMTAGQVRFNALELRTNYFPELSSRLPAFGIVGYFSADELVAFRSFIDAGSRLEAYYVGLDGKYNRSHQLYQNMLYDFLAQAIDGRYSILSLSRTALEIKSSLGAKPRIQRCYIRHRSGWKHRVMRYFIPRLNPTVSWAPRHPFKTS